MKHKIIALLVTIIFFLAFSPAQQQSQSLSSLQQSIAGKLEELNKQLLSIQTHSNLLQQTSMKNQAQWEERLANLNLSYQNILEELNSSYKDMNNLNILLSKKNTEIKNLLIILTVLVVLSLVKIALKVVAFILMAKGIPVPRAIDILV